MERHVNARQAIIFDFDYTLADSSDGVVVVIDYALRQMGLPTVTQEQARRTIGLSLPDTIEALAGPQSQARRQEFVRFFVEAADRVMLDHTRFLPHAVDTVNQLASEGYRLAIVSTKFRRRIEPMVTQGGIADLFETIIGGNDVPNHKPAPDSLLLALQRMHLPPDATLYVGDSLPDAQAARAAGLPFVAVLSGPTRQEELAPYAPLALLPDIAALPAYLDGSE